MFSRLIAEHQPHVRSFTTQWRCPPTLVRKQSLRSCFGLAPPVKITFDKQMRPKRKTCKGCRNSQPSGALEIRYRQLTLTTTLSLFSVFYEVETLIVHRLFQLKSRLGYRMVRQRGNVTSSFIVHASYEHGRVVQYLTLWSFHGWLIYAYGWLVFVIKD